MGNKHSHHGDQEEEEPTAIELLPSVIKVKQEIQKVKFKLYKQKKRGLVLRSQQQQDLEEAREALLKSQRRLRRTAKMSTSHIGYWGYYKMVQRAYQTKRQLMAKQELSDSTELVSQSNTLYFSIFALWEAHLLKKTHVAMMQQKQQKIHKKGWNKIVLMYSKESKLLSLEFDREAQSLKKRVSLAETRNTNIQNVYLDHVRNQDKFRNKLEASPWHGESMGSIVFESSDDEIPIIGDSDSDFPVYEDAHAFESSGRGGDVHFISYDNSNGEEHKESPSEPPDAAEVAKEVQPEDGDDDAKVKDEEKRKEEERRFWAEEEARLLAQAEERKAQKAAKLEAVLEAEDASRLKAKQEAEEKERAIQKEEAERLERRNVQKAGALQAEQEARMQAEEERNWIQETESKLQTEGTERLRSTRRSSLVVENQARDMARTHAQEEKELDDSQARIEAELEEFRLEPTEESDAAEADEIESKEAASEENDLISTSKDPEDSMDHNGEDDDGRDEDEKESEAQLNPAEQEEEDVAGDEDENESEDEQNTINSPAAEEEEQPLQSAESDDPKTPVEEVSGHAARSGSAVVCMSYQS